MYRPRRITALPTNIRLVLEDHTGKRQNMCYTNTCSPNRPEWKALLLVLDTLDRRGFICYDTEWDHLQLALAAGYNRKHFGESPWGVDAEYVLLDSRCLFRNADPVFALY